MACFDVARRTCPAFLVRCTNHDAPMADLVVLCPRSVDIRVALVWLAFAISVRSSSAMSMWSSMIVASQMLWACVSRRA